MPKKNKSSLLLGSYLLVIFLGMATYTVAQDSLLVDVQMVHKGSNDTIMLHLHWRYDTQQPSSIRFVDEHAQVIFEWENEPIVLPKNHLRKMEDIDTTILLKKLKGAISIHTTTHDHEQVKKWKPQDLEVYWIDRDGQMNNSKIYIITQDQGDIRFILSMTGTEQLTQVQIASSSDGKIFYSDTLVAGRMYTLSARKFPSGFYRIFSEQGSSEFRIINPLYKNEQSRDDQDWSGIDTSSNLFLGMNIPRLEKAARLTKLRMNKEQSLELQSAVSANNYPTTARLLMLFWIEKGGADWKSTWQDYIAEVNEVHNLYKVDGQSGVTTDIGKIQLAHGSPDEILASDHEYGTRSYLLWIYYPENANEQSKAMLFVDGSRKNEFKLIFNTEKNTGYNWENILFDDLEDPSYKSTKIYQRMAEFTSR